MNTVKAEGTLSAARSAQNQLWSAIASLWSAADMLTKMKWAEIGRQLSQQKSQMQVSGPVVGKKKATVKGALTATSKTVKRPMPGYKACISVVSLRAAVNPGAELDITPPAAVVKPQGIPPVQFIILQAAPPQNAASAAPAEAATDPGVTMTIALPSGAYPGAFQVFASEPILSPNPLPTNLPMTLIQFGNLQTGECDLTAHYLQHYPAPVLGTKVAMKLVPVSADGFRGAPLTVIADVVAAPALQKAA